MMTELLADLLKRAVDSLEVAASTLKMQPLSMLLPQMPVANCQKTSYSEVSHGRGETEVQRAFLDSLFIKYM